MKNNRVLIVHHNQQSLQDMEGNLRERGFEVTKCGRVEDASARLWMKGSVFDIIIIEQCLLGVNEFELLRIGKHKVLPVILTFKDDQLNIVQWSSVNGTCEYQLKLIPMSVLNLVSECMLFKKNNEWAQVQQPTNNVSRERNQRMSWTPDSHKKFVECVQKLGGPNKATPRKILQLLQSNFKGFEDVDREKISSHLQKYRDSLKKWAQPHTQSGYQMEEHPPMTLVDQVLKTPVANEPDISSQQQQAPAAKNTQGFQSVTLPFETNVPTIGGSTSCGKQSNALMIQMDEAFSSEQMPFVTLPFETNLPTIGGSTNCGNQSNALMIQMDEAFSSEQMPFVTLPFETNLPTIGGSTNCGNQSNALMIQMDEAFSSEQMPFVTLPFETNLPTIGGSTSCGNQSNALMRNEFTGGQPFDYESLLNDSDKFSSLDTFQGGISGDPGLYFNNAPLRSPFHTDHGEHGCSQHGIAENCTGDVIAREHFNNL